MKKVIMYIMTAVMIFLTIGCSDSDVYSVSVKATGINGTVVLQNNGKDNLSIPKNGTYTFDSFYYSETDYNVTILSAPSGMNCTIKNGSGTIGYKDITNITLVCTEQSSPKYSVGGIVSGLNGTVVLQNNGGDNLTVNSNGNFTFATKLADGSNYQVSVKTNPTGQTCSVNQASGIISGANITNVAVTCVDNPPSTYSVSGTASGLNGTVVLQNNGGDDLTVASNGNFTFATKLIDGTAYSVSIKSKPASQTCTLSNESGTINGANITNISLSCTNNEYSISFNVHGLDGGLGVLLNGSYYMGLSNNSTYTFSGTFQHGYDYNVTIDRKPDKQECIVYNGVGTIDASNITNIDINCTTVAFTVGGSLTSGDPNPSLVLQNNGGDDLTLTQGGSFTFATPLANGDNYNITVKTPPTGQVCSITNGTGTISGADITNIGVNCVDETGTLSANVKDLNGTITLKVLLTHDGTSEEKTYDITNTSNQLLEDSLAFDTDYNTTINTHPTGQVCKFTDNSQNGTVSASNNHPLIKLTCTNLPVPPSTKAFVIKVKPSLRNGEYMYVVWKADWMDYLYNVDCNNDGTYEGVNVTGDFKCIYDSDAEQEVSIIGNYPSIHGHYNDCQSMNHVVSVMQWGDQHWLTMASAFGGCGDITTFDASDKPDLSHVASMANMFQNAKNFNDPSINDWNVTTVTDMHHMFNHAEKFNQPLSKWDVSNVMDMNNMFNGAYDFNQSLGSWDVSRVKNMYGVFAYTKKFNNPDINNWNVSAVTNMSYMFNDAKKFNQPLNKWNNSVKNVTNMKRMFLNAHSFDQDISNWDVSNVTNHTEFDKNSPIEGTNKEPHWQ